MSQRFLEKDDKRSGREMGSKPGNQIVTEGESDQKTFRSEDWVQKDVR